MPIISRLIINIDQLNEGIVSSGEIGQKIAKAKYFRNVLKLYIEICISQKTTD